MSHYMRVETYSKVCFNKILNKIRQSLKRGNVYCTDNPCKYLCHQWQFYFYFSCIFWSVLALAYSYITFSFFFCPSRNATTWHDKFSCISCIFLAILSCINHFAGNIWKPNPQRNILCSVWQIMVLQLFTAAAHSEHLASSSSCGTTSWAGSVWNC